MFIYNTGTRPNEAMQLTYDLINYQEKKMFIPAGIAKTKSDADIPLSEYFLNTYKGEGKIFKWKVNYYNKRFDKLRKQLKLDKGFTPYGMKHTTAVHMVKRGVPVYEIMKFLRHSSLRTTETYIKRGLGMNLSRVAVEGM